MSLGALESQNTASQIHMGHPKNMPGEDKVVALRDQRRWNRINLVDAGGATSTLQKPALL